MPETPSMPEVPMPEVPATDSFSQQNVQSAVRSSMRQLDSAAGAERVNRTHRVVRERAQTLQARRSRIRSLYLPLGIFSVLLIGICIAVWSVFDEYEVVPIGSPIASYQMFVLLIWSVPVSAALLAIVWFRQSRASSEGDFPQ
jgi:hypothetical protein